MANGSKIKVRTASEQPIKQDNDPGKSKPAAANTKTPSGQQVSSHSSKVIQPPGGASGTASAASTPQSTKPEPAEKIEQATASTEVGQAADSTSGSTKLTQEELKALEQDMASNPIPGAVAEPPAPTAEDVKEESSQISQPTTQPQPVPSGAGIIPPPVVPQPAAGRRFNSKRIAIIAGIIILGIAAFWGYLQFLAPRLALANYVEGLGKLKTGSYSLNVIFRGDSGEGVEDTQGQVAVEATATGDFDNREAGNTIIGANLDGKVDLGGFKTGFNVDAVVAGDVVYVNVGRLSVLGLFGGQQGQQQDAWFSYDVNNLVAAGGCSAGDFAAYENFLANRYKDFIKLSDTKRVSLLPESVDGARAAHYSGRIDPVSLQTYLNEANKEIPERCRNEDSDFEDMKNLEITYDLWAGRSLDRLKLVVVDNEHGTTTEITLTTRDYGKDISIDVPSDAQPFEGFDDLLRGAAGGAAAPTPDGSEFIAPDAEVEVQ